MNKFANAVRDAATLESDMTLTENGAVARSTTGSAVLDLYAVIGAMRNRTEHDITSMLSASWLAEPLLTLKMVFYARNIRGGLGERNTARTCMRWIAKNYPQTMKKNFANVAKFGRADDFYALIGTPVENEMWAYLKSTIYHDMENMTLHKPISLTAKWLKSTNTHSPESCALGRKTARMFGLTERNYRKMLSHMRRYLNVVEVAMSNNEWDGIEYDHVPAGAMKKYRKAFRTHCPELFDTYVEKVEKGEAKINAATLYPYDLVREYIDTSSWWGTGLKDFDRVIEAQWKALPNYVEGEHNVLVMADVSGSMFCDGNRPIATSIGLATYFAERNKGAFEGLYMTFTNNPHYISIDPESSLHDKIKRVEETDMGYNTNLERAFNTVLRTAVDNHISQEEMPRALVVVSDMQIDPYFRGNGLDFVSEMARRFRAAGYEMPKLVLWNVEARSNTFHASAKNPYVQFLSGSSASSFKGLLETLEYDAWGAMVKVLTDPMYDSVVL